MRTQFVLLLVACYLTGAALTTRSEEPQAQKGGDSDNEAVSATAKHKKVPYDHILMIMLENVGYDNVIGSSNAPYINNTLLAQGTLFTNSFGIRHPSLPNYLALFAGSTLWVTNDHCINENPPNGPFNAPNLYSELKKVGKTALGYMESLPYDGYTGCEVNGYVQKHNPFMFFNAGTVNKVPYSASVVYSGPYPSTAQWPNFAMISPNEKHDMHNGKTIPAQVTSGDTWLSQNLPPLITYAKKNNGLVIVTMDESMGQHVPTILVGAGIPRGKRVPQSINHYNVTKTIVDNFGIAAMANTVGVADLAEATP
jgi:phosphatidylinositol-3-phosphatase